MSERSLCGERQQFLEDTFTHLKVARQTIGRLGFTCDDFTAKIQLDLEFERLEDEIEEFAKHQLGMKRESK